MRPNATEMCKKISFMTALYTQQAFPGLANREQFNFHEDEEEKSMADEELSTALQQHCRVNFVLVTPVSTHIHNDTFLRITRIIMPELYCVLVFVVIIIIFASFFSSRLIAHATTSCCSGHPPLY